MLKKIFSLRLLIPLLALLFFASCDKEEFSGDDAYYEELILDIENLTPDVYAGDIVEMDMDEEWDVEMRGLKGQFPCFKLVFPVDLIYPDGSIVEGIESREDLRAAMHQWKEDNPDSAERPVFAFPIDVITKDGTTERVQSAEELEILKNECRENRPDKPRFRLCFDPDFPLTIKFPDGTTEVMVDKETMRTTMKEWKENNPDSDQRPVLVFPIQITNEDGTTETVNSMDELKELLKDCVEKMRKNNKKKWKKKSGGK